MVNRAKSLNQRRVQFSDEKEMLIQEVLSRYRSRPIHTISGRSRPKGMRVICKEVSDEHARATGRRIELSPSTLAHRAKGRQSQRKAREAQAHFTKSESQVLCQHAISVAKRGFPFSPKRLAEHANYLLRLRTPSFSGVGIHWTRRFVDTHHTELTMLSSRSLDGVRASAVNETTVGAWFDMVDETITQHNIQPKDTYGTDEVGLQPKKGESERVIGPQGVKIVYQVRSGSRETITIIVTICADGTSIEPIVIFKGKRYLLSWDQENPLNASIACSAKGWVTGEIALGWIEDFDKRTREKANGRYRLLLVDGHISHIGFELLEYARTHKIEMLCYPSHTTHILQGLDRVCFGPLKKYWSEERDKHEQHSGPVTKSNFLQVLACAYKRALTEETIKSAFRVTGIVPFDPSVIGLDDLAPATEHSCRGSLPLSQPAPVQAIVDFLQNTPKPDDENAATELREKLSETSVGFLVSTSPIPVENARLPSLSYKPLDPIDEQTMALTEVSVTSMLERSLQGALKGLIERDRIRTATEQRLAAQMALQGLYCDRLRSLLAGKRNSQKQERGQFLGDGMPVVLTGDSYHDFAAKKQEQRQQDEERREAIAEAKREHKEEVEKWKQENEERIKRNRANTEAWKDEVKAWKLEKEMAKAEKRGPRWHKPIKPKAEKGVPKPKLTLPEYLSNIEESESDSDDDDDE